MTGEEIRIRNGEGVFVGVASVRLSNSPKMKVFSSAGKVREYKADRLPNHQLIAVEAISGQSVMVVEPEIGIERGVAVELIDVAMELVGSGLGDDVDDVAGAPSILGSKGVVLNLELLHRVDRRNIIDRAPLRVGIPGAIQHVSRGSKEAAGKVEERNVLVGVVGARTAAAQQHLALRGVVHRGVQGRETINIAQIKRQLDYFFGVDVRRYVCILGVQGTPGHSRPPVH